MSNYFNFWVFKKKILSPSANGCCTWSENVDIFKDREPCPHSPVKGTTQPVVEWLSQRPDARSLMDLPSNIREHAFCSEHVVAAINACVEEMLSTHIPRTSPVQTSRCDGPSLLGSDSAELQTFQSLSHSGLPSPPDSNTKRIPTKVIEGPFIDCGTHHRIDDIAKLYSSPQTSKISNEREEPNRPVTPALRTYIRRPLSQEDQRRRSLFRDFVQCKSETRTRSASIRLLTRRVQLAFDTMYGDTSYDEPALYNERRVVDLLNQPLVHEGSGKGQVYAIRDPELGLVKIGYTIKRTVQERFEWLCKDCKLPDSAYIITDPERISLEACKQLEKLVHEDLRPHRWFWECECTLRKGGKYFREHHEWFEVSDDVAIRTINLWTNFLMQNPYGLLEEGKTSELLSQWAQRLRDRESFPNDETHDDHDKRLQRWRRLFQVNGDSVQNDVTASSLPRQSGTAILLEEATGSEDQTLGQLSEQASRSIVPLNNEPLPVIETPAENLTGSQSSKIEVAAETVQTTAAGVQSLEELQNGHAVSVVTRTGIQDEKIDPGTPEAINITHSVPLSKHYEQSPPTAFEPLRTQNPAEPKAKPQLDAPSENKIEELLLNYKIADLKLDDLVAKAVKAMRQKKSGLPERSIYSDLVQFRWPVACCVMIALHTPYAPVLLSFLTWSLFLPFFVSELREWQ